MGQKVSPIGLRVGIVKNWDSRWYANNKDYATLLHEDIKIRAYFGKKYNRDAAISKIEIERPKNKVNVFVFTAKPGYIIGVQSKDIEKLKKDLEKMTKKDVNISVVEISNMNIDAKLVAENIAKQIENRSSFRIVQKRAIQNAMRSGAKGIKTMVSGRLAGADMARSEGYSEGRVPLHTLRADIDYATAEADTTYGKLGVKVWICKGEILPGKKGDK